jgi:putative phosphoribosyl transferase
MKRFVDRADAGRALAASLKEYEIDPDTIVLAIPRGGVPVAFEIAVTLEVRMDVLIVRKIGVPWNPEYAVGAVASDGIVVMDETMMHQLGLTPVGLAPIVRAELDELERRERLYRGDEPYPELEGHTVLLVDDGLATGSTMLAAIKAVRTRSPRRVVVAVPIASAEACADLDQAADRTICLETPDPFYGVGVWYEDFSETSDEQVLALLAQARVVRSR